MNWPVFFTVEAYTVGGAAFFAGVAWLSNRISSGGDR